MNIIFMGTPDFAVPCLKALIDSGEKIQAVFTQPDKPKGRGYKLTPPPVKELAMQHDIPVYQPESFKKGESAEAAYNTIKELSPDLIVVVAYGKILPPSVLEAPKYGCINVHASLLPRFRGAAPIQFSILSGDKTTGVTTMQMADGIDTGDMLMKSEITIGENETASELHDRLSILGSELIVRTVEAVRQGTLTPVKQDDSLSSHAGMITKDMCAIDFTRPASEVHNQIRGLSSYPCAHAYLDGRKIKFYRSTVVDIPPSEAGTIVKDNDFTIACGDGRGVNITEVQAEGGKRMRASDFLNGSKLRKGTVFTDER